MIKPINTFIAASAVLTELANLQGKILRKPVRIKKTRTQT